MSNPLVQNNPNQQMNPMQMVQQIKNNPAEFLRQIGISVPEEILGDPQAIIQHLMQNGKINQAQLNQAYAIAQKWGIRR